MTTPRRFLRPGVTPGAVTPAPKPVVTPALAPIQATPATPAAIAPRPNRFARPGIVRAVVPSPVPEPVVAVIEEKPAVAAAERIWPSAPRYLDWDVEIHCEAPWLLDDANSPETHRINMERIAERRRLEAERKNK